MSNTNQTNPTETTAGATPKANFAATLAGNSFVRLAGSVAITLVGAAVTGVAAGYAVNKKWGAAKPAAAPSMPAPAGK